MDFSYVWRYILDGALASLKFLLNSRWTFPLSWLIISFLPPFFFYLYFLLISSVFKTFRHSSQDQRGCHRVCFFFFPFFIYFPKKTKAGDCSWMWDQAPAFASRVAQDRILYDLPHIYFIPLQQFIKEDCFVPSYYAEVL